MPSAPTGLSVTGFSSSEVDLGWGAVAGATYNVYAAAAIKGGFGAYVLLNASPLSGLTFADKAANSSRAPVAGETYLYRVTSIVSSVESAYSTGVSGTFITAAARVASYDEAGLAKIFESKQTVTTIYTRYGYSPVSFQCFYDRPPSEVGTDNKFRTQKPEIRVQSVNVPYLTKKDQFGIDGIVYYVKDYMDDGWGVVTVQLSLTAV